MIGGLFSILSNNHTESGLQSIYSTTSAQPEGIGVYSHDLILYYILYFITFKDIYKYCARFIWMGTSTLIPFFGMLITSGSCLKSPVDSAGIIVKLRNIHVFLFMIRYFLVLV